MKPINQVLAMTYHTVKPLSQSDIAIRIKHLVHAVMRHDCPAFTISYDVGGDEVIERTELSHYFDHIRQRRYLVNDETYDCSEHLLAFREACYDIGIEFGMAGMTCLNESEDHYLSEAETLNWLVEKIRGHVQSKWFKRGKHVLADRLDSGMVCMGTLCLLRHYHAI